ncbi:MAG: tRNA lysidine(34) synthetase TilS [Anaerolineales bacterium]|nr:tRNA lysidine(34) synthetase TilS [Chloroflexota bacterium]MBL6983270.1 tRNA lysidine(34) synthetase TilS [Anaerolineales bacterium]
MRIDLNLDEFAPLVVGVSGGPDSLCLLDLLHREGFSLVVAHLDHGLRPESADEARGVELVADSLGVRFVSDVRIANRRTGKSIEEAARNARYQFLFQQAFEYGAQAVVVGHNADDQAETVLMHLLRGSGLGGLKGMRPFSLPNPWSDEIPLVRPLLKTWRSEIEEYCQQRGLEPIQDSSNADTKFFRNRLRHELIPLLDDYVPGVAKRLWHMADILAEDDVVLEEVVAAARDQCLDTMSEGYVSFGAQALAVQHLAVQRRLIRWAVSQLRPDIRDLDYDAVRRALTPLKQLAPPQPQKQYELALGIRAFIEDDLLYIAAWDAVLPSAVWPQVEAEVDMRIPGEVELANGWRLKAEYVQDVESAREQALENADPYRAWIDLGNAEPTLIVRSRRAGDSFQPFGMGGQSSKISDFMINQKIPARARDGWPLVCVGEDVAWVVGLRLSDEFRLTEGSKRVFYLELISPTAGPK